MIYTYAVSGETKNKTHTAFGWLEASSEEEAIGIAIKRWEEAVGGVIWYYKVTPCPDLVKREN